VETSVVFEGQNIFFTYGKIFFKLSIRQEHVAKKKFSALGIISLLTREQKTFSGLRMTISAVRSVCSIGVRKSNPIVGSTVHLINVGQVP